MLARLANLPGALPGACAQGLIWGIMAIGVYLTYRILDVADLTVDGSFGTGGAVCVMCLLSGQNVWVSLLAAVLAGLATGFVTGLLHTFMGIPAILSGILTQLALYSINLKIMGKANQSINVDKYDLLISLRWVKEFALHNPIIMVILVSAVVIAVLYWFFGTELGCAIRATGSNPAMSRAQGINTNFNIVLGLAVSNALVALSGALLSQYQGFADVGMGRGAIVIGLAAVIIGEAVFGRIFHNFALKMVSVSLGAIIYYIVIQLVLTLGFDANLLKLLSASVVAVFLAVPYWKGRYFAKPAAKRQTRRAQTMLEIQNVSKTFNAGTVNEKTALNGLNLKLNEGDFVTVIGGNGAGKSTMLNAVAGVWPVDCGKIIIDGVDVTRLSEHQRAAYIGRVFQDPMTGTAATMQIEENLALAARRGKPRTLRIGITRAEREQYRELLKSLDLGLENRLTARVGLLSGGQRQALTLLMATMNKPKLLLLDEHTAALDPKTALKVLTLSAKIVEENHLTTMMITHNMKDAIKYGNRLIMMHEGHIIYDVSGEEKKNLQVSDLLAKFQIASGGEFANDRMILS